MSEILTKFDRRTQELLTSVNPDLDYLNRLKFSESSNNDALKVVSRAYSFLLNRGTPPWDRLHITDKAYTVTMNLANTSPDIKIAHLKQFEDGVLIVGGAPSEIPVPQVLDELIDWVNDSSIRRIDFPVGERTVSMMLTNPKVEELVQLKADYPFLKVANEIQLPELEASDYWLYYRTDAWVSPETGNVRWQAIAPNLAYTSVNGDGVNRRIVHLVEAMVDLGENYFNNHPQLD